MQFEWDLSKEEANLRKHGVSFTEAMESFLDPQGFMLVDRKHSGREKRYFWVGRVSSGQILTTRLTQRGDRIRIIGSARWRKYRRLYNARTKSRTAQD